MKKNLFYNIFLILFLILNNIITVAQIRVGLHVGLNLANAVYSIKEAPIKTKIGLVGGGLIEYKVLDFLFIQPEFSFIQKGINIEPMFDNDTKYLVPDSKESITLNYFQIPLLLKIKFEINNIRPFIFAGPNFGFLLKTQGVKESPTFNKTVSYKDHFESVDFATDFGLGAEYALSKYTDVFANLRYSLGLSDNLKSSDISYNTRGIQFMVGIKICIFNCEPKLEEQDSSDIDNKILNDDLTKKTDRIKFKEFNFGKYDIPFFVTGYYRPNTTNNLEEIINLKKNILRNANYIETITKNSSKYKQYKNYAQTVDTIFQSVCKSCQEDVFPNFIKSSKEHDTLEISVYGYADPRTMSGKYLEDESIRFIDKRNKQYFIEKGDALDKI
jgi:hypothetical protein